MVWCFPSHCTQPTNLKILTLGAPLQIASPLGLKRELREYARRQRLPTETHKLQALFERYLDDEDKIETDLHIQVYSQLMQAVNESLSRKQPLWVVK